MKVAIPKEISETTEEELTFACIETCKDMQFSSGEGIDFFNASVRAEALEKEAKSRGLDVQDLIDKYND